MTHQEAVNWFCKEGLDISVDVKRQELEEKTLTVGVAFFFFIEYFTSLRLSVGMSPCVGSSKKMVFLYRENGTQCIARSGETEFAAICACYLGVMKK